MSDPLLLLLDVQERDLAADQLRHRRATLADRATSAQREQALEVLDAELARLGQELAEGQRAQRRLEDEVTALEAKQAAENVRLYSGSVTSPRELQALQDEIAGLARRQREIEDDLLGVMETTEPVAEGVTERTERRAALVDELTALRQAIAGSEAVIDGELVAIAATRAGLAANVPAELLAMYETLRARLGGVGVARLEGTQCTGCHLSLPATEIDAVRHAQPGVVVLHEECGRILVR